MIVTSQFELGIRAHVGSLQLDVELSAGPRPTVLIGPNGSGKTTLLRILCGAVKPENGFIRVAGRTLFDSESGLDLRPEQRRLAYVPQGFGLFPHLDVLDNVAFGLRYQSSLASRIKRREAALVLLRSLGCEALAERFVPALSGGEQQKVALARALLTEPEMLLLDEPLSALDAGARRATRAYLAEQLQSCGRPSLVVTHDARDVNALDADVFVLQAGRIVQSGTLAELRSDPKSDFVAEFVDAG